MRTFRFMLLFAASLFFTADLAAQKVRILDGSLDALKGVKKMNVQYDYSKMGVGKYKTEQEYLAHKKEDYDKKEAGKGDEFAKAWEADRGNRFQPQFEELFVKHSNINLGNFPDEKYTLIFKTTFTEPGFNVYVHRKNAEIDGEAWIVETANPSSVIAKVAVQNCPGRTFGGNDYDSGTRLQEAYAVAGKGLGKFLGKALK